MKSADRVCHWLLSRNTKEDSRRDSNQYSLNLTSRPGCILLDASICCGDCKYCIDNCCCQSHLHSSGSLSNLDRRLAGNLKARKKEEEEESCGACSPQAFFINPKIREILHTVFGKLLYQYGFI